MEFQHCSVLPDECMAYLNIKSDGIYVDGTLGGGGHALLVLQRLSENGRLIGIDRDAAAIEAAGKRLSDYGDRLTIVRNNYTCIRDILDELKIERVDGILLDLGVSSYQLDAQERGFSYRFDTPLDMRMDQRQSKTARDIVNTYSEERLCRIIRDYGEERYAKNIARNLAEARSKAPVETTGQLVEIIRRSIPVKAQVSGGHPAKRTFQAIRIECNEELEGLKNSIDPMIRSLKPGGRLCIITFHSLEDRIVKTAFKTAQDPCICPKDFPVCVCGRKSLGRVITRKPVLPQNTEMEANPRSASAKLRVFERIEESTGGENGRV